MGTSKDILIREANKQKEKVKTIRKELNRYKKAYNILMDWFDYIPEEDRQDVCDQLDKVGL